MTTETTTTTAEGATTTPAPAVAPEATTAAAPAAATTAAPAPATTTEPETPVEYSFELPEGVELDEKGAEGLTALARDNKFDPEVVQKIVDLYAERVKAQTEQFTDMVKGWETEVKKDPALGGDKLAETITVAKTAIDKYGSPELLALLDSSKMGSHPEVIRFLHKVGLTLKEDAIVTGKPPVAPAKSFYENSNMAP